MEAAHVRLPKVPPPTVFASLRGVYWGMIPGGDGLVCRLAVLRLLGTSLGWLLAGLELTDGHLRGQAGCDSHAAPDAGGESEGRTLIDGQVEQTLEAGFEQTLGARLRANPGSQASSKPWEPGLEQTLGALNGSVIWVISRVEHLST